ERADAVRSQGADTVAEDQPARFCLNGGPAVPKLDELPREHRFKEYLAFIPEVDVLSPIAWRTPPRQYGAWETVASNITEGLVARGWDVTLFASRDSVTRAHLHAVVDKGYEEDSAVDPKEIGRASCRERVWMKGVVGV